MIIYLVRHGEAKHPAQDPERGLTPRGKKQVEATARAAAKRGVRPSMIFHSGKKRAEETAAILAEHLRPLNRIETTDDLAPNDDPSNWAERLTHMDEDVMLVGHLPHLPGLAALLLNKDGERETVPFQTATIAALEKSNDNSWKLLWSFSPEE